MGLGLMLPKVGIGPPSDQIALEVVYFDNRDPSEGGALTLRRDLKFALPYFEWERGRDFARYPSVVAYPTMIRRTSPPRIGVRFGALAKPILGVTIRAQEIGASAGILGAVPVQVVDLQSQNRDGRTSVTPYFSFELPQHRLSGAAIGKHLVEWQWQYKLRGTTRWVDFDRTGHTVYTVLDVPGDPWRQPARPSDRVDAQRDLELPWTVALDVACRWADGATTPELAATRVTEAIYSLGGVTVDLYGTPSRIEYDIGVTYVDTDSDAFLLSSFLNLVAGTPNLSPHINCVDCSAATTVFSNLLGCRLSVVKLSLVNEPPGMREFPLNSAWLVGTDAPGTIKKFAFHEVAWDGDITGSKTADARVFDACCRLDADADPANAPHDWKVPTGVQFGALTEVPSQIELGYLHRLVAPGARLYCAPVARISLAIERRIQASIASADTSALSAAALQRIGGRGFHVERLTLGPLTHSKWRAVASRVGRQFDASQLRDGEHRQFFGLSGVNGNAIADARYFLTESTADGEGQLRRLLGTFEVALQPYADHLGDTSHSSSDAHTIVFRRSNVVVMLANAGKQKVSLASLANAVDQSLLSLETQTR